MENFVFAYPTKNYFGKEAAKQALNAELPKYGKNVLLAYGGGSIKRNGIYDEVMALLQEQGKEVTEFQGIMSNPTYAKVQEGAKLCRNHKIDFILAVGGGSVSDCCKAVSAQAKLTSDLYDYEYQEKKIPQDGIPMGVIVTAAGTGSEQNAGAVITYEEKNWKGALWGTPASFRQRRCADPCALFGHPMTYRQRKERSNYDVETTAGHSTLLRLHERLSIRNEPPRDA